MKTQISRACGVLSKIKQYTTLPVLKVVHNSLIHPYLFNPQLRRCFKWNHSASH